MAIFPLPRPLVETNVRAALAEDLGDAGDITTLATIPAEARADAVIAARKPGIIAGTALAEAAFTLVDPALKVEIVTQDGGTVEPGTEVIRLSGPARAILTAERVALNYLGHLSGIATATGDLVRAVEGTGVLIVCTRKTTPGLRTLEKHAVKCGGGQNHRFGLYDAVMIKDNHIAAAGSIAGALQAAKAATGHMVKIEIEVDTLDQLGEVLEEGADVILLDNMSTEDMRKAVEVNAGRSILEASGNVTIDTVRAIAETGVDVISSGWITHSAPTLDLGLDWK
ncbi:carboxylating nicotinate-nucleotide diphosphorylase [Parvularcula flava]|uniref:Probable nicotinate-nucleotide pyrophosphorylase [carboxylating] n=1 Tax=Aquisalinus luteolus TaxID=1566827 RepID=A0A8J3A5E8_9PROT|nr:carboxylating nicotinate-nucleotide diphosphorylase [Aquisalinus luteolus]NHK28936.1 carboxylating nicotinate-nucleotide diphosphorylase [Aquisalinus luteolus]GGI00806.1 nicotinate-nucleotide diphosphorylase (carboxylating) [Aquisalinus luteolus]